MTSTSAFWDDVANDLEDPEFLREFIVESMRIATIDEVVNALDDAREAAGLSKAELARAIQVQPATIRRLFASNKANPISPSRPHNPRSPRCRPPMAFPHPSRSQRSPSSPRSNSISGM